jgi:hypothetical protein
MKLDIRKRRLKILLRNFLIKKITGELFYIVLFSIISTSAAGADQNVKIRNIIYAFP